MTTPVAPGISFRGRTPHLAARSTAERAGRRRYGELTPVAAVPPGRSAQRIQYWSFAGVTATKHREVLRASPVSYDLTIIPARPMGWERPKTHGHVHVAPGSPGRSYPELYEVLEGRAGFLVQDLEPGPSSSFATLIEASAGDVVVLPAGFHHVSINLGSTTLVFADLVCRDSDDDYSLLRAAHGMAHYVGVDDGIVENPAYRTVPTLTRLSASEWAGSFDGPIYGHLLAGSPILDWLCTPARDIDPLRPLATFAGA